MGAEQCMHLFGGIGKTQAANYLVLLCFYELFLRAIKPEVLILCSIFFLAMTFFLTLPYFRLGLMFGCCDIYLFPSLHNPLYCAVAEIKLPVDPYTVELPTLTNLLNSSITTMKSNGPLLCLC